MRAQWSTLFFASLLSAFTLFAADPGWAQGSTASGSTGAIESPIGKIITTSGDVTIEHATVVAVQASLTSGPNPLSICLPMRASPWTHSCMTPRAHRTLLCSV
jgi:hypothetical protein